MDSSVKSCHVLQRVSYNDEMNEYKNCKSTLQEEVEVYTLCYLQNYKTCFINIQYK